MPQSRASQKAMFAKWGFDSSEFKKDGFQKTLKELDIPLKSKPFFSTIADEPTQLGFEWNGEGIKIVTTNNPITGEFGQKMFRREPEKDFSGSIGIEGDRAKVLKAVKTIKMNTSFRKGESKNARDFV